VHEFSNDINETQSKPRRTTCIEIVAIRIGIIVYVDAAQIRREPVTPLSKDISNQTDNWTIPAD
jgi:hypothetical protein